MEELFIPIELALLAKEKGFDQGKCLANYSGLNKGLYMPKAAFDTPLDCGAPLYAQIIDWLEKEHKFWLFYKPVFVSTIFMFKFYYIHILDGQIHSIVDKFNFKTKESCLNKSIETALNTIKS